MFSSLDYTECLISSCWLPVKSQDTINKKDKKKKKDNYSKLCVKKKSYTFKISVYWSCKVIKFKVRDYSASIWMGKTH